MKQKNHKLTIAIVLLALLVSLLLYGHFILAYSPTQLGAGGRLEGPSTAHLFGTDHMGRDVFARISAGAMTTLFIALGAVSFGAMLGLIIGAFAGFFGGWFDEIVMHLSDLLTAFPSILLALVAVSLTGPGTGRMVFILGVLFIPSFARVSRGEFRRLKNLDYVKRARLIGASTGRILFVHILPNTLPVFLSAVAIGFNNAVLAEASMSFLGLGVLPPQVSLGRMLSESQAYLFLAPWIAVFTGLSISLLIFAFSMLADALQEKGGGPNA